MQKIAKSTEARQSSACREVDGAENVGNHKNRGAALNVAVYARYSTDLQKETSIADQIRTCEEAAKRHGLAITRSLVFSDDAVTGAAKGTHKRERYHALRAAIRSGNVDVVVCDQQCRLARSAKESLTFFEELREHKVRLLTADGLDSESPTAQLLFGIKSVFSEFFLDETRHRVRRGMVGEFERGTMVSVPSYGYQIDVMRSATEGHCLWCIHPEQSEVVKEIFGRRKDGMSLNQIAAILNGRGVTTPKAGHGHYWRASGIWRLLQNPIYKGVYQVNFGGDKVEERKLGQRLMKDLALVGVADWEACQSKRVRTSGAAESPLSCMPGRPGSRGTYGGGMHPLAGVLRCGMCGAPLSCHKGVSDKGTMHCIQCEHATSVGVAGRPPLYVSIRGVRQMLHWLLNKVVTGEAITRYRECLRERLAGGRDAELAACRQDLERAMGSRERLVRLLKQVGNDDPMLEKAFLEVREDILHLERKEREIENGLRAMNKAAIQKQLDVDLSVVIDAFLADRHTPERTRALLKRIFPSIVLTGKTNRFTAIFRVEVEPGAILAEASETENLISGNEVIWLALKTSGSKYPVWSVEQLAALETEAADALTAGPG